MATTAATKSAGRRGSPSPAGPLFPAGGDVHRGLERRKSPSAIFFALCWLSYATLRSEIRGMFDAETRE